MSNQNQDCGTRHVEFARLRRGLLAMALSIMFVFGFVAVGCSQPAPVAPSPSPTVEPTQLPAAPSLPPKLPEQSALPPMATIELVGSGDDQANSQHPGYIAAELTGRHISSVSLVAGSVSEVGRQRILIHQAIDPQPNDDQWPGTWEDGVTELLQVWDFTGDYLWDGQQGDYAVLWVTDPTTDTRTAHGRYRAAGTEAFVDGVLVVNVLVGTAGQFIATATGEGFRIMPGDEIQLTDFILDDQGVIHSAPGTSLSFGEGGHLAHARRPVPSGTNFIGVSAESADGDADAVFSRFEVDNDNLVAGYRAFLDAANGFQLLFPETWAEPTGEGGHWLFSDAAGQIAMSISTHPEMSDRPIVDLKQQALDAYGDVSVLYEDQVELGQGGALRTAYGYLGPDGERTGVMLTFAQGGLAHVVDIDGQSSEEGAILELASTVANSWVARAVDVQSSGRWTEAAVDGLAMVVPAGYRPHQMSNGWQRFTGTDELTFVAMRSEAAADRGLFSGLEHWLGVAGSNVRDFAFSEIYEHERGDRSWARVDFEYALDNNDLVGGAIMLTRIGDRFLILWAEAPLVEFATLESQALQTMVDELSGSRYAVGN